MSEAAVLIIPIFVKHVSLRWRIATIGSVTGATGVTFSGDNPPAAR